MDQTRPDPDPRFGGPNDPAGTPGNSPAHTPAHTPGDTPGDLRPNDGFDPLDPYPAEADEDDPNDVTTVPPGVLPGQNDDMGEDDDLVSPGAQPTVPRSTPV